MPISPQDLVKDVAEVVALPEVCTRVISMTEGTKYSAAEIAQVVGRDPGLTTQILKIANSPYYGFPSRIDTISRAVTVIGNRELRDLVLATSVINTFSHMEDAVADLNDYWRHSLYVGVVARHLGLGTGGEGIEIQVAERGGDDFRAGIDPPHLLLGLLDKGGLVEIGFVDQDKGAGFDLANDVGQGVD